MSMQHRDSHYKSSHPDTFSTQAQNSCCTMDMESSHDLEMAYDHQEHLGFMKTSAPMYETEILQRGKDGKPSITLTSSDYDTTPHTPATSRPLLHLFRPISEDEIRGHTTHHLISASRATEEEEAALAQLSAELEAHVQGLKSEFEVKRGKSWTPLEPWPHEDWEWSDEGEDVFGWS